MGVLTYLFSENCMKIKEFGPPGGSRAPGAPPLRSANEMVHAIVHAIAIVELIAGMTELPIANRQHSEA